MPTVHLDSIFLTCTSEAQENCDVAIMDVPSAFIHTLNDEDVIILLKGRLAELMVFVASQIFQPYIFNTKGLVWHFEKCPFTVQKSQT